MLKVLIECRKVIFSSRLFCIFIRIFDVQNFLGVNLKNLWCQNIPKYLYVKSSLFCWRTPPVKVLEGKYVEIQDTGVVIFYINGFPIWSYYIKWLIRNHLRVWDDPLSRRAYCSRYSSKMCKLSYIVRLVDMKFTLYKVWENINAVNIARDFFPSLQVDGKPRKNVHFWLSLNQCGCKWNGFCQIADSCSLASWSHPVAIEEPFNESCTFGVSAFHFDPWGFFDKKKRILKSLAIFFIQWGPIIIKVSDHKSRGKHRRLA